MTTTRTYDPRGWTRLEKARERTTRLTGAALLDAALASVHEHLTAYGHDMTWEGRTRYHGTCGGCGGFVALGLDGGGIPRAITRGGIAGRGDYAECPSVPDSRRMSRRRD
jgi:hypothetical protein